MEGMCLCFYVCVCVYVFVCLSVYLHGLSVLVCVCVRVSALVFIRAYVCKKSSLTLQEKKLSLSVEQVHTLIAATFSNTDQRAKALASIV